MTNASSRSVTRSVEPAGCLRGEVFLPGDKSISHRAAIFGSLARGLSTIDNFSQSDDCARTLDCLEGIGGQLERQPRKVSIEGLGIGCFEQPGKTLYAGNSGTSMRLLAGLLAGLPFPSRLEGDASLRGRPMNRILVPLRAMGGQIQAREDQFPPLIVQGQRLAAIEYELPVASSQVKSCVLLAGLLARGSTTVIEPTPTRNHTELLLPAFGGRLRKEGPRITVEGDQVLEPCDLEVPGDISAASFFLVAASLIPGSRIELRGVGLNPTRDALLQLLIQSGGHIQIDHRRLSGGEPIGDISVSYSADLLEHFPGRIRQSQTPLLIDEIPVLAILGTQLKSGLEVVDATELRAKESDRVSAIVENLHLLGVESEEREDGFRIPPGQTICGGNVRTRGDHRIAMAFAIAGLISREAVVLDNSQCCDISFPGFFEQLTSVIQ